NTRIAKNSLDSASGHFVQTAGEFQQSPNLRAAQASLESLSGQLHASSAAMTLQAIGTTGRALSDRLDKLSAKSDSQQQSMWMSNLNLGGSLARSGYANVSYQLDGWLVGKDVRLNRHALAGFAFSQGHGTERLDQ